MLALSTYKAIGVQTDIATHLGAQDILDDDLPSCPELSQKLLAIWGSLGDKKLGSSVISKLLVGCQRDFHILFGLMNINLPSKITMEFLIDRPSSGVALQYIKDCFHTPEAAKVSQLYLVLTKVVTQLCICAYIHTISCSLFLLHSYV